VVAQRISTGLKADKIVVLEKGRIAAEGTHGELMAASPIYREIFESQLGGDLNLEEATTEGTGEGGIRKPAGDMGGKGSADQGMRNPLDESAAGNAVNRAREDKP